MFIIGYDCMTTSGNGFNKLMDGLYSGFDTATTAEPNGGKVCFLENRNLASVNFKDQFVLQLTTLYQNIFSKLPADISRDITSKRIGVIFCSTKGCVEDYIWKQESDLSRQDPYNSILQDFVQATSETSWIFSCSLSNACSSSHIGIEYAQELFRQDRLDYILVLAGDLVGPFVYQGFKSLKVLTSTKNSPFDQSRNGLQLGDGFAALLMAKSCTHPAAFKIDGVASETEGALITRPSLNGDGLLKALQQTYNSKLNSTPPDFVIAHGTGTTYNDLTEDAALSRFFESAFRPPVTGTKWSVGHTLGVSGMIDVIAACEVIQRQKLFSLFRTQIIDRKMKLNYILNDGLHQFNSYPLRRALITSLGFGGVNAAIALSRAEGKTT